MAMKCVAIILVGHLPPFKQRVRTLTGVFNLMRLIKDTTVVLQSNLYSFIEVLFSTIRLLLPIIPWILYFIQINQVVAVVGTIAYCGAKVIKLRTQLKILIPALISLAKPGCVRCPPPPQRHL